MTENEIEALLQGRRITIAEGESQWAAILRPPGWTIVRNKAEFETSEAMADFARTRFAAMLDRPKYRRRAGLDDGTRR